MIKAVCISCGAIKEDIWETCPSCQFDPNCDETSAAKSVYLSFARFDNPVRQEAYSARLGEAAATIRAGTPFNYDAQELKRLLNQKQLVGAVRTSHLVRYLLRLFAPGIILLIVIWTIAGVFWLLTHTGK
jgi:hypothetical protein